MTETEWLLQAEHQSFIDDLMKNAPDSWEDDDASAESIAIAYVRVLEQRVVQLRGTLERYPEDAR